MRYRSLGGLDASMLAIGAASFGGIGSARRFLGRGDTESEAHALLDRAVDAGINLVDTANSYGDGASERMIGAWLRARRARMLVMSKVGIRHGLARDRVIEEVDESLRRLGVDALDYCLAHRPDPATPWADVMETFALLVARGNVRKFGVSNVGVADLAAIDRACVVQNRCNLLDRDEVGREIMAYSPLAGGLLAGRYDLAGAIPAGTRIELRADLYAHAWTPSNARRVSRLVHEAASRDISPAGLATWWVLQQPFVASIAIGARTPAQLAQSLEALALPPDPVLQKRLEET